MGNKAKWSSLANEHALVTVATMFFGGLISVVCRFSLWPVGIYGLVLAAFLLIMEYPRSGRAPPLTSSSNPRPYQHLVVKVMIRLGGLYTDYFSRFFFYSILSIPCFVTLSTIIPGINLLIVASFYLVSRLKEEKWVRIDEPKAAAGKSVNIIEPPSRPPPRPATAIVSTNDCEIGFK